MKWKNKNVSMVTLKFFTEPVELIFASCHEILKFVFDLSFCLEPTKTDHETKPLQHQKCSYQIKE